MFKQSSILLFSAFALMGIMLSACSMDNQVLEAPEFNTTLQLSSATETMETPLAKIEMRELYSNEFLGYSRVSPEDFQHISNKLVSSEFFNSHAVFQVILYSDLRPTEGPKQIDLDQLPLIGVTDSREEGVVYSLLRPNPDGFELIQQHLIPLNSIDHAWDLADWAEEELDLELTSLVYITRSDISPIQVKYAEDFSQLYPISSNKTEEAEAIGIKTCHEWDSRCPGKKTYGLCQGLLVVGGGADCIFNIGDPYPTE
ncbi:hypothetical protein [Pontibacter sp. G13]|uniref:hypothetical protein n=1 Tax=Pontibacter sp. G13 TaxID=3074898 RepID=UPI00288B4DDB|nr:hypothetical protein [Pontibacter sp. G13]WNJ17585.1 hypothetical protein RJD25_22270 [Pontibacter sp. G13]